MISLAKKSFWPFPQKAVFCVYHLCDSLGIGLAGMNVNRKHPAGCDWTVGLICSYFYWDNGDPRGFVFVHFPKMLLFEALRICVWLSKAIKLFGESVYVK